MAGWTNRNEELLRDMYNDPRNFTIHEIAAALGRSRNAVLGYINRNHDRLGLAHRNRKGRLVAPRLVVEPVAVGGPTVEALPVLVEVLPAPVEVVPLEVTTDQNKVCELPAIEPAAVEAKKPRRRRAAAVEAAAPLPAVPVPAARPTAPVPFHELPPDGCRYILTEPFERTAYDAPACGAPKAPGMSWCPEHAKVVFNNSPPLRFNRTALW